VRNAPLVLNPLYQDPSFGPGVHNPTPFFTGPAIAYRIIPVGGVFGGGGGNKFPRSIIANGAKNNQNVSVLDSSWVMLESDETVAQLMADPSRKIYRGPQVELFFGIEQTGASTTDSWLWQVAESVFDLRMNLTPPWWQGAIVNGNGVLGPVWTGGSGTGLAVAFPGALDQAIFDGVAGAGAAISSGTISQQGFHSYHVVVRGLVAVTRTLQLINHDGAGAALPIFTSAALATASAILQAGNGSIVGATPSPGVSAFTFPGPLPVSIEFNLTAGGADTPRLTVTGRQTA
jgi:hypothetical protein